MIPEMPFDIELIGGRKITVIALDDSILPEAGTDHHENGEKWQPYYIVSGFREWTYNGEWCPKDVLLTLLEAERKRNDHTG